MAKAGLRVWKIRLFCQAVRKEISAYWRGTFRSGAVIEVHVYVWLAKLLCRRRVIRCSHARMLAKCCRVACLDPASISRCLELTIPFKHVKCDSTNHRQDDVVFTTSVRERFCQAYHPDHAFETYQICWVLKRRAKALRVQALLWSHAGA